ncbi:MAG TPA: hypothetical protein VHK63_02195 [Candidatus Limnocylindria bacterium]|nr:hypothetical protein [Candidatus Limnocylindria bacterium]
MKKPSKGDASRRARLLRADWRERRPDDAADAGHDTPAEDLRRSEALDSNDRLRAEAPDDLETRRRADELEREIKRPSPRRRQ